MCAKILTGVLILLAAVPALADHDDRGVTLYRDSDFRGSSETFFDGDEIPRLGDTAVGNDSVSSVRVGSDCQVTLYSDSDFRGTSVTLTEDAENLGTYYIGNDSISSIRVECSGNGRYGRDDRGRDERDRPGYWDGDREGRPYERKPGLGRDPEPYPDDRYDDGYDWRGRRGVVLYSDADFRGREELFDDDDPSLKDNPIRQDTVSSLRLAPGCRVILYEDTDFRGASTLIDESLASLHGTEVGNDRVSSLEVRCRTHTEGVTIYEHTDFRGRSESFVRDDPQLRDNFVRQDGVSSVRVAPGCVVTLYEHPNYRGRSTTLREDVDDLRVTWVGNDTVSSLRVDCRRRARRHR